MKPFEAILALAIGFLMGFAIAMKGGEGSGRNAECARMMDEAVKNGHARYFLDPNNERKWEWLPACNVSKQN